jgi:hypothetical protein
VTERLKVLASKASVRETVPWVRIPPSPPLLFFGKSHGESAVNVIPFYCTYPTKSAQPIDDNRVQEFCDAFFRLERLHFP